MVELHCENCGKTWDYKGGKKVLAPCPDCRRLVKLPQEPKQAKEEQAAPPNLSDK